MYYGKYYDGRDRNGRWGKNGIVLGEKGENGINKLGKIFQTRILSEGGGGG